MWKSQRPADRLPRFDGHALKRKVSGIGELPLVHAPMFVRGNAFSGTHAEEIDAKVVAFIDHVYRSEDRVFDRQRDSQRDVRTRDRDAPGDDARANDSVG